MKSLKYSTSPNTRLEAGMDGGSCLDRAEQQWRYKWEHRCAHRSNRRRAAVDRGRVL